MNDTETMEYLGDIFQRNNLPVHFSHTKRANKPELLQLRTAGYKRVSRTAGALLPYLHGTKQEVASNVLEFCNQRLQGYVKDPITEEQVGLIGEIERLNGNRRKPSSVEILRDYMSNFGKRTKKI